MHTYGCGRRRSAEDIDHAGTIMIGHRVGTQRLDEAPSKVGVVIHNCVHHLQLRAWAKGEAVEAHVVTPLVHLTTPSDEEDTAVRGVQPRPAR